MPWPLYVLTCFCAAALLSWVFGFAAFRALMHWNVLDFPNERSSHNQATARGGGLVIVAVVLLGLAGFCYGLAVHRHLATVALCVLVLAFISFLDDLSSLSPAIRFGCHAAIGVITLVSMDWPILDTSERLTMTLRLNLTVFASMLFLWVVGYTNAFNFMDGINGIAAGQALVTSAGSALLVGLVTDHWTDTPLLLAWALAGAAAGFLPHNFPRARMFLGDVGSAPLGFLLAILTLWLARDYGWWLLIPLGLLHANFVLDTALTLLRRVLRGDPWYEAHCEHFYQRLVRSGRSHTFATGCEMALQLVVLALMSVYLQASLGLRCALIGSVLLIWLAFFMFCEAEFKRAQRRLVVPRKAIC